MIRRISALLILLALMVLVSGCSQLGPEATPPPPTKTPKPTFTPTPDWSPTPEIFPTETPIPATATPEGTATPEVTATSTPEPVVRLTARGTANVRSGPGTSYPKIGTLAANQAAVVTGKNTGGDWVQFDNDGQPGWVTTELVTLSGDLSMVQVAENVAPPPTARPRPTSPPAPPPAPTSPPAPPQPSYPWRYVSGSAIAAPQCGSPNFEGQVQYASGSGQNGVCIYLGYYGPRSIKYSGSGGKGDGNWGFSPCGAGDCNGPFELYVVQCPPNVPDAGLTLETNSVPPAPASDKFTANISNKCTTGQWTNIIFKGTQ